MCLFNLIEQDDRVWFASDSFGQSATFFIADVARRRTNEAGNGVLFHKFAHIDSYHSVRVVKEKVGEGFGEFRLADAGWAEEQERSYGAVRV